MPWLALALLPLPLAVALPRQIDIIVALALLEWPQLLAIGQRLRAGDTRRLAAALNGYPPLILATLALAQPAGSLEVAALARLPGDLASESAKALHWLGALALALALPPALGIGPFADEPRPTTDTRQINHKRLERRSSLRGWVSIRHSVAGAFAAGAIEIGLRLRGLGLVALAALPWSGTQDDSGWALLRMLAAAILIAALLWGYDRLAREQPARRWARAYLAFDATLLLALMWAAYQALQARLG
jgi:formate hydrogenlyase subunit 4